MTEQTQNTTAPAPPLNAPAPEAAAAAPPAPPFVELFKTLSAFIVSLGMVIARLIVLAILSLGGAGPMLLVAWILARFFRDLAPYVACYMFVSFVALALVAFTMNAVSRTSAPSLRDLVRKVGMLFVVLTLPFTFPLALMFAAGERYPSHYMNQQNSKALVAYFTSVIIFALDIYFLCQDQNISKEYFVGQYIPSTLKDALAFTIDIAIRGLFFDFLEHFNIHISEAQQSTNFLGKLITYTLRLLSLVLAITLILEMIASTREKLATLDQPASR